MNARVCVALLTAAAVSACGGGGGSSTTPPPTACTVQAMNQFVIDLMIDDYLYYDQLPNLTADDADSPEEMMVALRVPPDRFSRVDDEEDNDAFFDRGEYIGVGVGTVFVTDELFVREVFDGPASDAGIVRGDQILAINGRTIPQIVASGDSISEAFDSGEVGNEVSVRIREQDGDERDIDMVATVATMDPVPQRSIIEDGGRRIGYLEFKTFITPSYAELDEAFAFFADQGVDELVLDLRYNGGGLLNVASQLAQQIGGNNTAGELFYRLIHSDKDSGKNTAAGFPNVSDALSMDRLYVISTGSTASASEMIINGLRPYIDVVVIGGTTLGKPVGSRAYDFCGRVALPVLFEIQNALGQADYFDGLLPQCPAEDELSEPLGSVTEASLAAALTHISTGSCPTSRRSTERVFTPPLIPQEGGFRELLGGAY